MTYKELMNRIFEMTPEQQAMDVTVYLLQTDEYIPVAEVLPMFTSQGVLDENHPVLTVDF